MTPITTLLPHQVFCFGSNSGGMHFAGAAGYACRGVSANTWRTDPWALAAMTSPKGSPKRVGKWAVYGVARGWQKGREGMSYAIETIHRPGEKRSVSLGEIDTQLVELFRFAQEHPEWEFLMTGVGAQYAGHSHADMATTFARAIRAWGCLPDNVIAPGDLYDVDWRTV